MSSHNVLFRLMGLCRRYRFLLFVRRVQPLRLRLHFPLSSYPVQRKTPAEKVFQVKTSFGQRINSPIWVKYTRVMRKKNGFRFYSGTVFFRLFYCFFCIFNLLSLAFFSHRINVCANTFRLIFFIIIVSFKNWELLSL